MTNFIGEYECKLDPKGRILLPAALKKQLPADCNEKLVINRGFEQCLVLYPRNEWENITREINNKLNLYNRKDREFIRYFNRGATELVIDSTGRILFPKKLLDYAGAGKDIILFGFSNRIEVWAKEKYESLLTDEPDDFARLAEEVMGKNNQANESA